MAPVVRGQQTQTKPRVFIMVSLKRGLCPAVVPHNDCDILSIDQLSRERDQYKGPAIREAALGWGHPYTFTYKSVRAIFTHYIPGKKKKRKSPKLLVFNSLFFPYLLVINVHWAIQKHSVFRILITHKQNMWGTEGRNKNLFSDSLKVN